MRIGQNIPALQSYNALAATNDALAKSINRLSTGLRINSASDDAAGLAISEKMRAQTRGLDQAVRNAQDGMSMIQTAEGALGETHSMLQRMRELAVQAANDSLTRDDRAFIQLEIDQLKEEIDRISTTTQFNKKSLLDGSSDALWSTSELGAAVLMRGTLLERDRFNQLTRAEGNYRVVVAAKEAGQGQVLKSNIFTHIDINGDGKNAGKVAGRSSYLSEVAEFYNSSGKFILEPPQELTLSFADGGSTSITVYPADTIGDLGQKINLALREASTAPFEGGSFAQWVGRESTIIGPVDLDEVLGTDTAGKLTKMLLTGLLEDAAARINDFYGLDGRSGKTLKIIWADLDPGTLANAQPTGADEYTMRFNNYWFNDPARTVDWDELRGTLQHELTHVMQFCSAPNGFAGHMTPQAPQPPGPPGVAGDGWWLVEGMTEYIAQGSERVYRDFMAPSVWNMNIDNAMDAMKKAFSPTAIYDEPYYSAAYLATRYFDQETRANGGVRKLIDLLDGGTSMDSAIDQVSGGRWATLIAFRDEITDTNNAMMKAFIMGVINEDRSADAGMIGGLHASGGPAVTQKTLLTNQRDDRYKANPVEDYGFVSVKLFGEETRELDALSRRDDNSGLSTSPAQPYTLQSVDGTLLLHSNIAGGEGKIILSGSEELIRALGFAEIQEPRDPEMFVSIYDAHSGATVVTQQKYSGSTITGMLHANIDITTGANFALSADGSRTLGGGYGTFVFGRSQGEFIVHITENSTVLQVGANQMEIMAISFGDMSAAAIGVADIKVTDRESAAGALGKIDAAIGEVSRVRARLGAYQNRLEHTVSNLTAASTNTKDAESRIRDADMAKEMMEFTKLNILSQAGNSMLAQANQLPQNVLSLIQQ